MGGFAGLSLLALLWPQDLNVNEYFVSPWGRRGVDGGGGGGEVVQEMEEGYEVKAANN